MKRIGKRASRVLAVLGLSMALLGCPAEASEEILSIAAWQKQAEELELARAYDREAEVYTRAIGQYPTYTDFYIGRGQAYLYLGDTEKADLDFKRALTFDDQCAEAILGQATLLACKGEMVAAWSRFEDARILMEDSPLFYLQRGKYYYQGIADYPHALRDMDNAISLAPAEEKPSFYLEKFLMEYNYATLFDESYMTSLMVDSAKLLDEKKVPDFVKAQIHNLRADAYLHQKDYRQGFRETEHALALSGSNTRFQSLVFRKQYEILHHMELFRDEQKALGAALKRNPGMTLPRKYEPYREAMSK